MRLFDFRAKDPDSDKGTAIIVVRAESQVEAGVLVEEHLRVIGRPDLIPIARCFSTRPDYVKGVVYSDVERQVPGSSPM